MTLSDKKIDDSGDLTIVSVLNQAKRKDISNYRLITLQRPIFINGELVYEDPDIWTKQEYCASQMETLYPEVRRTLNPQEYYVDGTREYVDFKANMIEGVKKRVRTKR